MSIYAWTPVCTEAGLVAAGALKVGDRVKIEGGSFIPVAQVYPIREEECWALTMLSGEIIAVGETHAWHVWDAEIRVPCIVNTRALISDLKRWQMNCPDQVAGGEKCGPLKVVSYRLTEPDCPHYIGRCGILTV